MDGVLAAGHYAGNAVTHFLKTALEIRRECLIRHKAVGLNYIDTYHRTGLYPVPLPSGIGLEAAGVVEAVGASPSGHASASTEASR